MTAKKRPSPRLLDKAARMVDEQPNRHPVVFDQVVEQIGINPNESQSPSFEPWDDLRNGEVYQLEYPKLTVFEAIAMLSASKLDMTYTTEDMTVILEAIKEEATAGPDEAEEPAEIIEESKLSKTFIINLPGTSDAEEIKDPSISYEESSIQDWEFKR